MPQWSEQAATAFWNKRRTFIVMSYPNVSRDFRAYQDDKEQRSTRLFEKKRIFMESNQVLHCDQRPNAAKKISGNLHFWAQHSSWSYCNKCNMLNKEKLFHTYCNRKPTKCAPRCQCSTSRYIAPTFDSIPQALRNLTPADNFVLRPVDLHIGDYERLEHGYRRKNGITRVTWSKLSVEQKIQSLENEEAKRRCATAYNFLMSEDTSSYKIFVEKRDICLQEDKRINIYNFRETEGIECCLWPSLYPYSSWCETLISNKETKLSGKVSFITKVLSEIVDYSLHFELIQFQFDRWIFKTVTGAINIGRMTNCSPARALEAKTFSTGFWQWQHRFLLDALRQFGYPSVFVTISPYEWTFPFPDWLKTIREQTGKGPTNIAALETLHISHVLEQLVRGYLCGSNNQRWKSHVFNYNGIAGQSNIHTYFYRFEFQQRGTAHLHLLVWLKNISKFSHNLVRADIPWEDAELAFLVQTLQKSDKGSLPLNAKPTQIEEANDEKRLSLHHPQEAFAIHLRAYISSILPALQCRMDFQMTDGKAMILRYVTSYVSKWHDGYSNEGLYSIHVTPYQAAYRHVREMQPCEPEMWLHMTSQKIAWSASRTKKYVTPLSDTAATNKVYRKYMERPVSMEQLSLLQWLRHVNETPPKPKPYKGGNTLVGVKMVSPYRDEYFFQDSLLNVSHREQSVLYHPLAADLPDNIKFFAAATTLRPKLWRDPKAVQLKLEKEGHKDTFVSTVLSHIASLHDVFNLWQRKVLTSYSFTVTSDQPQTTFPIEGEQLAILKHLKAALKGRHQFYNDLNFTVGENMSEDEESTEEEPHNVTETIEENIPNIDWRKFILVKGQPGTGKTQVLLACIQHCIEKKQRVLVAAPTGYLANTYKSHFQDSITADTIHSTFKYPVQTNERPAINWNVADNDVVVIDEISMVSKTIFQHIIVTMQQLLVRPVLLLSGDNHQQQPIETVNNRIVQTESILADGKFYQLVSCYVLRKQHRCIDPSYKQFLDHIRYWNPSQQLLDTIQEGKLISRNHQPSDKDIAEAVLKHPTATILTVSRKAALHVNEIAVREIFSDKDPLAIVQLDNDAEAMAVYKSMRVVITQNRNKESGVVNGQRATVERIENCTIFLKLPNNKLVNIFPVTFIDQQGKRRTCYPFVPCYAVTICKAQGQTLTSAIVWFDVDRLPAGSAYVALSRVKRSADLIVMTPMKCNHFQPVK